MNFDIHDHTIFLTLTGSRAYGTHTEESDYDFKGIAIPPPKYYLGVGDGFEQYEGKLSIYYGVDLNHESVIYDLRKYLTLAVNNNPNILELLFLSDSYWIKSESHSNWYKKLERIWMPLLGHKDLFLSKKCRYTYAGYAHAQLKRIRGHRQWLLKQPDHQPTRKEFGLSDQPQIPSEQMKAAVSIVDKQIESWTMNPGEEIPVTVLTRARESIIDLVSHLSSNDAETEIVIAACRKLGFESNFSETIVREKDYRSACREWKSFLDWKDGRNEKRCQLEQKYGYDTKHAMHLVRLMRTCEEILTNGKLLVTRPDAEELKTIRNGAWKYDDLEQYAKDMDIKMDKLYQLSTLRHSVDKDRISQLCKEMVIDFYEFR